MNREFHGRKSCFFAALLVAFFWGLGPILPPNPAAGAAEGVDLGSLEKIEVFPPEVALQGKRRQMQLVVTGYNTGGEVQDLTHVATYQSSDPSVVDLKGSVALPRGDGAANVQVQVGGMMATVPVVVSGQAQEEPVSFNYGTLVALSKQGCNAGACHGSPSGKGGFRMSLRAFDPTLDTLTLIREDYGRRANTLSPDESLLLLKPLMKVPHGGGRKLKKSDPAYQLLHDWIAEGCHVDPPDHPRCVRIEVYPPTGRLLKQPAHTQQLCVLAHFSDGSVRDITSLAVYSSSDTEVATITESGLVTGNDRGESAIIVRYLEFIVSTNLTFIKDIEGYAWTDPPTNNYIDEDVYAKLKQLRYLPSGLCSDEEFIRRVYLDVIGLLPTTDEVTAFLSDSSPGKRVELIDRLLERPEYPPFWALKWGDLLRLTSGQVGDQGVYKYHRWLEEAIRVNMPYDEFARQLLTATGSTLANPAANFYRTSTDTNDSVESISQIFLGARLQCAKCHNHPFERWTQDNYYGMAAFFNRVQRNSARRPGEMLIWVARTGEVTQPRTGKQMKPWLPLSGEVDAALDDDRRKLFAEWLTQPDNPFFARIEVNRIWSQLLGKGIVDPPDDFRDSNPPSNAPLLDALAADFVQHGFDRKHVIRTILNSRTYQADFRPNEFNEDDAKYFSHYQPRLLSAEQLLDAICHVTAVPEQFSGLPAGTKATQLPAPDLVKNEFLKIFGQPERQTVCACERTSESNLGMAIQFFNGPLIYNKLRDQNNRFRQLLGQSKSDEQIITELHVAAVCRPPTEQELQASLRHIAAKDEEIAAHNAEMQQQIAELNQQISELSAPARQKLYAERLQKLPESLRADVEAAIASPADARNAVQKYLVEKLGPLLEIPAEEIAAALDEATRTKVGELQGKVAELGKQRQSPGDRRVEALEDICWALLNTNEFLFQH